MTIKEAMIAVITHRPDQVDRAKAALDALNGDESGTAERRALAILSELADDGFSGFPVRVAMDMAALLDFGAAQNHLGLTLTNQQTKMLQELADLYTHGIKSIMIIHLITQAYNAIFPPQ